MTTYFKYTVLAATMIFAAAACRKDRPQRGQHTPAHLLMRTTEGANKVNRYEYTQNGQLSKQVYFAGFTTADSAYMTFSYKDGMPEKMSAGGEETRYFYANGRLAKMEVHTVADGMQYYWEYQYESGRLVQETGFEKVNGGWKANARRVLTYDAQGNLAKREFFSDDNHSGTFHKVHYVEYTGYLDHPDPVEQLAVKRQVPGTQTAPRLCTKEHWYDGQGFEEWTTEYSYRFNEAGYPVEKAVLSKNPDGHVINRTTITYAYNR